MSSRLRRESTLKRPRPSRAAGDEEEEEDECPVCMTGYTCGTRTERARVAFPCGHSVCRTCDANMRRRNFHSCPTCRTPREGFSQTQVDLAARARTLADAEADDTASEVTAWAIQIGGNQRAFEEFLQSHPPSAVRPRQGGGWHVMFFPNESTGDPFSALRLIARESAHVSLTQRRVRHSSRRRQRDDDDEEGEGGENGESPDPAVPLMEGGAAGAATPPLDPRLRDLITNHLLQPSDLSTFLARHREATEQQ